MSDPSMQVILRLRYAKAGKVRFTSHRDVARIWERALRRVGIPVLFTEGFTPRPKVSFGLALPTGYESAGEYLDVFVARSSSGDDALDGAVLDGVGVADGRLLRIAELPTLLSDALPHGMCVQTIELRQSKGESLQQQVTSCRWEFEIIGLDEPTARRRVDEVLECVSLPTTREHKGAQRTDDLRPSIHHLSVIGSGVGGAWLEAELAAKPRVVRPSELVDVILPGAEMGLARRTHQTTEQDGARRELISYDATPAPHAERCAS